MNELTSVPRRTNKPLRAALLAIIVVCVLVGLAGVAVNVFRSQIISGYIASTLRDPHLIEGSKVTGGSPWPFITGAGNPGVSIQLSQQQMQTFLNRSRIFADCTDTHRTCTRKWSASSIAIQVGDSTSPPTEVCLASYPAGRPDDGAETTFACIDKATRTLYFQPIVGR